MAVPHVSTNFPDVLTPEFKTLFDEEYEAIPDMLPMLYNMVDTGPRGDTTKWSNVGTLGDFTEFTGTVGYQSQSQGYDTTATHVEFANGVQVERKLFDDDLYNIFNQRPAALGESAGRTRQKHGARSFVNSFQTDSYFYNNTENVALCSNSHTTTSGASTANGFDNLATAGLTAAAVSAARIQMKKFRGDQAERISVIPDELLVPVDLEDKAIEIVKSQLDPASANNAVNPQSGRFKLIVWEYLTDTNDWWMMESRKRRRMLHWVDRVAKEFAMIEDFDTLIGKWRCYMRYSNAWTDWRFILGSQVS
jgi:phage major head subunit gpT-like protein